MSRQGLFDALEPPPMATDRIFFAIMPDADAIADIVALTARLKTQHGMRGRPTADTKLHVTLHHLGDFAGMPHAKVASAKRAAEAAAKAMATFVACFDTAQSFVTRRNNRPLVLTGDDGVIGIAALHRALASAMPKAGLPPIPASYTPHITLLYDDITALPQPVAPVEWRVRELLLLHSRLGQGQPYTALGRWPLRGQS
ncbi:2'-5' RNA ligase family protein [Duganella aceris]|uniref:2'-5' RNA ligase n=1 Tax=Duganella aceris TaxID=2703883 RepID=A0ABX0FRA1_9BURK|nr:2'-5' RNA ligase family protein [Duganella aceris]NGZ87183.1 2'-5' RNA ligase [Duganella aceris]